MFLPPPRPIPYLPPSFTRWHRFYLSLHSLPPLPPSRPVSEQPSKWTALPTAIRRCLSTLPSHVGPPKGVPCARHACFTPPRCSPLPSSTCAHVPISPRVIPPKGPSLPLPDFIKLTPAPPPAGLYWRPSPLPVLGGGVALFVPPPPVLPPYPPHVPRLLLVYSEVYDVFKKRKE